MGNMDIPNWLKGLPLAPVYRPTDTEFADPIAYISKIEKEASAFGICKIIPPLPKPSKKYVFFNLNKTLLKCPDLGSDLDLPKTGSGDSGDDGELRAVFTTRQQELGQSPKRARGTDNNNPQLGVHKQVWQSGEMYTLEQFESKSRAFSQSQLGMIKEVSPLVVEALFWKAASEKPIYIEYANDVPGSGFGEPEGRLRHFHRRRRKRGSYKRRRESFGFDRNEMANVGNVDGGRETKDSPTKNDLSASFGMQKPSNSPSNFPMDEASRSSRKKIVNSINDMEGTAGWKLANSPWNLQMIARSPGSLTRFMPDDIPGVTSPMVYIGMLFSWFAWHVEDHELHSMNFLHTGSPKTWYAIPGDYAFDFEEVIRTKAYGGNIDRLAALTLLGEKTTLLTPEMIVASGIPCCRLIQNSGEFVVTFPRAYHVGFSHGFNVGEAANLGTPQWLKVAKEAAARRAAMNYLPMLSHQQLLYLLTMSFVSRVPRSLLPGARSSRLRDRQREERELLVKKAFIEDMLGENKTLSVLLGREPAYRLVLWDPDLLPRHSKESRVGDATAAVSSTTAESIFCGHPESDNNDKKNTLLEEMSLFMENLNDLYLDEDDGDYVLSDFQVDSGTLACVACGILGFPFLSVVQPSEEALKDLAEKPVASGVFDLSLCRKEMPTLSAEKVENGWTTSSRFLRPRIFCLEHTVQVQKLFKSNGGVNILVICHKDYQKIKAHATTIAEEIGIPFNYNDVPLESASQEDLSFIDLAIEDEENNENGEDWTSELGINLRYCVKVRKNFPTKQMQHALSLSGLFSDKNPTREFPYFKWQLRRSRSKVKPSYSSHRKQCENIGKKVDEKEEKKLDCTPGRKEQKIIQYSRRKKPKLDCSGKHSTEAAASAAKCGHLDSFHGNASESNLSGYEHTRMSEMQQENPVLEVTRDMFMVSSLPDADTLATAASAIGSLGYSENHNSEMLNMEAKPSDTATENHSGMNHEINVSEAPTCKNEIIYGENCSSSSKSNITYGSYHVADGVVTNTSSMASVVSDCKTSETEAREENQGTQTSNDTEPNSKVDALVTQPPTSVGDSCDGQRKLCAEGIAHNCSSLEDDIQQEVGMSNQNTGGPSMNVVSLKMKLTAEMVGDGEMLENKQTSSASNEDQTTSSPVGTGSKTPKDDSSLEYLCNNGSEICSLRANAVSNNTESAIVHHKSNMEKEKETDFETENMLETNTSFIRSPCEGLRPRLRKEPTSESTFNITQTTKEEKSTSKRAKTPSNVSGQHKCNLEGCKMTFETKAELQMHKRNRCTHEGCGKKFRAHKYVVLHQRVHNDDRPFNCPWKGCSMTFKWAWARTEHMRLHTGERPYKCKVDGCGLSFRFVSDFSRHRRKTGHHSNSGA